MRFDNMAQAAMTPGGFNAGVNDIIQAILGAKANKAKMAKEQEQQAWDRGMQEKTLGQQMSNNLVNQGFREREVKANEMRAQTDQGLAGNKILDTALDNAGGVAKVVIDMLTGKSGKSAKEPTPANDLSREKFEYQKGQDADKEDLRGANIEVFGNPDGVIETKTPIPMTNILGKPVFDPKTGAPVPSGKFTTEKRQPTREESVNREAAYRKRIAARTTSQLGSGIVDARTKPNTGDTDGMSAKEPAPAPTPGGMGAQVTGAMGAKPPVDYASEDAKLQASDPQYRQLRSNPKFNWRAAIDATLAQGQ